MSLAEILPQVIDLSVDDRAELLQEIAKSMDLEVVDMEVEQRRTELESDPEKYSLTPDDMKAELQKLRDAR